MNKLSKILIISASTISILLSTSIALAKPSNNETINYNNLTQEQKKIKEDKQNKVNKMLLDADKDIIDGFNINRNSYIKLSLVNIPDFAKGKLSNFTDIDFCNKILSIIRYEMDSVPIGSLEPLMLLNNKEFIFSYKDKDGNNFIKRYEMKSSRFEKLEEKKKNGINLSLDNY